MAENNGKLNHSQQGRFALLRSLRRGVVLRAFLAIITILLTIIVLFSLTVAWYTNVVQSGGLSFQTEQWNFDGEITLGEADILMSPGSGGIVPLTIKNKGDHIVAASVSISKSSLTGEDVTVAPDVTINPYALMRERLYFYVDTTMTRGGEIVDRVYLSSNSSYTYTILPKSDLVLTEDSYNAPRIKWEWVYDVLGYYVLGSAVTSQSTGAFSDVKILDYIRPIEYEYDETKTTFAGAQLSTIDGETTVLEFLSELTKNDGYEGTITSDDGVVNGYYPVSVNEQGYGVWLHLCTYTEIQQNMKNDTALGQMTAQPSYPINILVSGVNSREDETFVTSAKDLATALKDPTAGKITLAGDVTLTETIALANGMNAILDLNGKTLTSTVAQMFSVTSGAQISLYDGTLVGNGNDTVAVYTEGGYVTMQNVTVRDVKQGVAVRDHISEGASMVRVSNTLIEANQIGIHIYGQKQPSDTYSRLIVENSRIEGASYAAIVGNGSYYGTDIVIQNSELSGYYTAIYHPQKDSILTITDSSLDGWTGLVVKGGTVTVTDSTILGTGNTHSAPAYNGSGFSDTGDGIYLEGGYDTSTVVYVNGVSTGASHEAKDGAQAVRHYREEQTPASIYITGGTYTSDVSEYCADGYACRNNGDGTFTVVSEVNQ